MRHLLHVGAGFPLRHRNADEAVMTGVAGAAGKRANPDLSEIPTSRAAFTGADGNSGDVAMMRLGEADHTFRWERHGAVCG